MSTMMPTDEERKKIQEVQLVNPEIPLGPAEQFLAVLCSIPELSERLKLWAFKMDYETAETVSFFCYIQYCAPQYVHTCGHTFCQLLTKCRRKDHYYYFYKFYLLI
jgi:Formin Homology 2 Domain